MSFLIKKNWMMKKMFYFYDRFFESNRSFTTEHLEIVKTPGFFHNLSNSRSLQVKWQP